MEPPNNRVPILRLPALPLCPSEPLSHSQLITSYLGVPLNHSHCYLSACLSETVGYIWSERPKESEDILSSNNAQIKLFKKVVRILRDDKPLVSLSDVSNVKHRVGIRYESPHENVVIKKIECQAELITAIFNERILEKQSLSMRIYRDVFAIVLEGHMNEFFNEKLSSSLKLSKSSEELDDPSVKYSPNGRMLKKMSQHPLMPWDIKPEPVEKKTCDQVINDLSMEHLYHCRTHWLNKSPVNDSLLLSLNLDVPQTGIVTEEEVARNISFELHGDRLAADIDRTMQRISINTFLKKEPSNKDIVKNFNKVSRFNDLLASLMKGLKINPSGKQEILEKWNSQVLKEKVNQNHDSFPDALAKFFNEDLDQADTDKNKLRQLVILMRQRMYVHPMLTIIAALTLRDIPLQMDQNHAFRQMSFQFTENAVEYHASSFAYVSKENLKKIDLPPFELEMLNVMRASLDNLDSWSSKIKITIKPLSKKKELIKEKVLKPLVDLGFTAIII